MQDFKTFRRIRKTYLEETRDECRKAYKQYKAHNMKNIPPLVCKEMLGVSLGDCKATTMANPDNVWTNQYYNEDKGNNPMLNSKTNSTTTDITINAPAEKTDAMKQREFLLAELTSKYDRWNDSTDSKLVELFNINGPSKPDNWSDLMKAIADKAFTFDQARFDRRVADYMSEDDMTLEEATARVNDAYGLFSFVTFTAFPKPDYKGYEAARMEWRAAKATAKQDIMILDPKDGLSALRALEAWTPTGKAN